MAISILEVIVYDMTVIKAINTVQEPNPVWREAVLLVVMIRGVKEARRTATYFLSVDVSIMWPRPTTTPVSFSVFRREVGLVYSQYNSEVIPATTEKFGSDMQIPYTVGSNVDAEIDT
jgi:hypothetical protein